MNRVGLGYDVHRLIEGRPLILGGVEIPYELGLSGHSDADVLGHAIMDALLGAAGLGDIGIHFPDTDAQYHNISSIKLLERVGALLLQNTWQIVNIDSIIIAQEPKLSPFVPAMIEKISMALQVQGSLVSIKATTTENLGFVGEGKGMAAQAVALIQTGG